MTTRDAMLAAIRQSLAQAQHLPTALPRATLSLPSHSPHSSLHALFTAELQKINGTPLTAPAAEVPALILRLLQERNTQGLLSWGQEHLPVPGLWETLQAADVVFDDGTWTAANRTARLAEIEKITVGLTGVDAVLADTGTLALSGGPGRPRLASLSVRTHIALYTPAQLHASWAAWWAALTPTDAAATVAASSSLTLISGPSRTADIEMTLTVGVHGPKEVVAVCVEG